MGNVNGLDYVNKYEIRICARGPADVEFLISFWQAYPDLNEHKEDAIEVKETCIANLVMTPGMAYKLMEAIKNSPIFSNNNSENLDGELFKNH